MGEKECLLYFEFNPDISDETILHDQRSRALAAFDEKDGDDDLEAQSHSHTLARRLPIETYEIILNFAFNLHFIMLLHLKKEKNLSLRSQ